VSVAAAYISGNEGGLWLDWHISIGIFLAGILCFRIAWGLIGSSYSRFSSFLPTPGFFGHYKNDRVNHLGHSPLAGASVLLMLLILITQISLGLFAFNDDADTQAPLYPLISSHWSEQITTWHSQVPLLLIPLVVLHLLAIAYHTTFMNRQLILPMITGNKKIDEYCHTKPVSGGGIFALLFSLVLAGTLIWLLKSGTLLTILSALTN